MYSTVVDFDAKVTFALHLPPATQPFLRYGFVTKSYCFKKFVLYKILVILCIKST